VNTEHLFGIYWGAQRLREADARRRRESGSPSAALQPGARTSDAAREAAYQRLFDAVREAVEESRNRP
jgi:hypothetical protein